MQSSLVRSLVLAAAVLVSVPHPAPAAIRCVNEYQQNRSGEVRTPYCEEDYLAKVARSSGINVTAAQIRASYSLEGDVCRSLANDIRVFSICIPFQPQHEHRHCRMFPCF